MVTDEEYEKAQQLMNKYMTEQLGSIVYSGKENPETVMPDLEYQFVNINEEWCRMEF